MKARTPLIGLASGLALIAAAFLPTPPRLVWNQTESLPTGLYLVSQGAPLARKDIVAYAPLPEEAALLEGRGYTGRGWPLIKRIAALEGDSVCRLGALITINGIQAATALVSDGAGRSLPAWSGCRTLQPGEVFLLGDHARSLDGRYFGVQRKDRILGAAELIWRGKDKGTRPATAGSFAHCQLARQSVSLPTCQAELLRCFPWVCSDDG